MNLKKLSFHESSVVKFTVLNNDFIFELEDVKKDDDEVRISLIVEDVSLLEVDDEKSSIDGMPAEDGEILELDIFEEGIFVLVEWHNFTVREDFIRAYKICGNRVNINEILD